MNKIPVFSKLKEQNNSASFYNYVQFIKLIRERSAIRLGLIEAKIIADTIKSGQQGELFIYKRFFADFEKELLEYKVVLSQKELAFDNNFIEERETTKNLKLKAFKTISSKITLCKFFREYSLEYLSLKDAKSLADDLYDGLSVCFEVDLGSVDFFVMKMRSIGVEVEDKNACIGSVVNDENTLFASNPNDLGPFNPNNIAIRLKIIYLENKLHLVKTLKKYHKINLKLKEVVKLVDRMQEGNEIIYNLKDGELAAFARELKQSGIIVFALVKS